MVCRSAQEETGKASETLSWGYSVEDYGTVSSRFDCATSNQRIEGSVFMHICGIILAVD